MSANSPPIVLATRGSALALAQANTVLARCRAFFPEQAFEIRTFKTTGDHLQTTPPDALGMAPTKGLFTKELEIALLNREADLAVHSLKDLPTALPAGLILAAVLPRADVRDVLIFREPAPSSTSPKLDQGKAAFQLPTVQTIAGLDHFPPGAVIGTSSTRRQAQLLALRSDLKVIPIRGNVGTRLHKLAERSELDGLVLAAAGLLRLGFKIGADARLQWPAPSAQAVPARGLLAVYLSVQEMVPCVGQGAIGIETRSSDERLAQVAAALNDPDTLCCVTAERAFLQSMGGGCLSPVAAYGEVIGDQVRLRAVSFHPPRPGRTERSAPRAEAAELGARVASELKPEGNRA